MTDLKRTPLTDLHVSLGARMVPFAGYSMPVQYPAGIMKEHLHTRSAAGLFDVSHMGQIAIRPRSGNLRDAALALETLVPVDVAGLAEGRQRYGVFTDDSGGILDDLMIANRGDHLFLVVNAACKDQDLAHLEAGLATTCIVENLPHRALLALQGPAAEAALATLAPEVAAMRFMDVRAVDLVGAGCIVSRSGYTGEDGYEISVPAADAERLAKALLAIDGVAPVGLGARDSLRLEAGLCLHGNDIDTTTTPVEASLEWAIQKIRRACGDRQGGFPGADIILKQLSAGAARRRVGLRPETKAPIRAETPLFAEEASGEPIGRVTSGGFAPSLEAPVAMGYVPTEQAGVGTRLFAEVRGKRLPVTVTSLPFVTPGYKRR
ncbi:glycine cleavage system aminomethyltransferase GcvT [Aurantimonas aggregata]|uniref:aminomethyltransferase n=2 Tax=Aurantimonas aggregata TaxID=2047720 RepID=A0A6L9MD33_9HYPH|nr:glycine cleavage system aminomethyltransferase GcvT [Aurantimonas aggregata]